MAETEKRKHIFGLIGKNISYSFSRGYFSKKFDALGLGDYTYENFDIQDSSELKTVLSKPEINGLNVTIPYKEAIIPYLDELNEEAKSIGAVNTIKFSKTGTVGYNTDAYGFEKSIVPLLKSHHKNAMILGTGGASKAIVYVLDQLGISHQYVSRNPTKNQLNYSDLERTRFKEFQLIINCTPLGTFPNIEDKPSIPYDYINSSYLLYDLVYNPLETAFLKEGKQKGATIQNVLSMLEHQAEKAWEIWNTAG